DAMALEEIPRPKPPETHALVRLQAVGVNFIDIYQRMGLYPVPLPFTPGNEGAGTVEEIGPGVTEVAPGDPVTYSGAIGSYAEYAVVPSWRLVTIPQGIDPKTAAAAMLQGMTAHYLTHDTYPLKPKDTCLVHAAAGGVGLLLVQMAKRRGARVIGTVSTKEKARLAREAGAGEVILYTEKDFESEVKRLTGGVGIQVVYDSVGQATFEKSMNCLAPRGYLVLYGQASGPVPPFDPQVLNARGSLFLTRPTLAHYTRNREELLSRADEVLGWVAKGKLNVRIGETFPLAEAGEAHRKLAGRETTGKILLVP
ncbi:MAG: quinone oxidoreductase, partial [Deltaproteobacteria bacterium]|nr:quinone oxidoreductase [Deltaproteobacteria bacterium]